mmetsp:Transcript_6445/g.20893  ORF Transcript_6445/g.20893 Transcript_6445/m.20893 type:complete len:82 (+) Transcript_6445:193-438(+)
MGVHCTRQGGVGDEGADEGADVVDGASSEAATGKVDSGGGGAAAAAAAGGAGGGGGEVVDNGVIVADGDLVVTEMRGEEGE